MISLETQHGTAPAANDSAPPLPIEGPIVQAAMHLLEAKQQLDAAFWLIQNNPRLTSVFDDHVSNAITKLYEASTAFQSYSEILSCRGQA